MIPSLPFPFLLNHQKHSQRVACCTRDLASLHMRQDEAADVTRDLLLGKPYTRFALSQLVQPILEDKTASCGLIILIVFRKDQYISACFGGFG